MNIITYANKVAETIKSMADLKSVNVTEVEKNNGIKLMGISIRKKDMNIGPVVYVDNYYKNGYSVKEAAGEVMKIVDSINVPTNNVDFYKDYEQVKTRLKAKLVNAKNKQYEGISAAEYGYDDLKIVPIVEVETPNGTGSIAIKPEHEALWNKNINEIVAQALENIKDDIDITTMAAFMGNVFGENLNDSPLNDVLVISNKNRCNGAIAAIVGKKRIEEIIGKEYVVLPSSIHEVIALKNEDSVIELKEMVKEINRSTVDPVDILSDNVYEFVG